MRTVFRSYVRARKHRKNNFAFKSYREIAKGLGGAVAHTTLRNWMREDFPRTFARMGGHSEGGGGDWNKDDDDGVGADERLLAVAEGRLKETLSAFRAVASEDHRAKIAFQTRRLLEQMEDGGGRWTDGSAMSEWREWSRRRDASNVL